MDVNKTITKAYRLAKRMTVRDAHTKALTLAIKKFAFRSIFRLIMNYEKQLLNKDVKYAL